MWGDFKSCFGWKSSAFLIEWRGQSKTSLLTISRNLMYGFSFVYIPWGPQLPAGFPAENRAVALSELAKKLNPLFLQKPVFLRFDPPWYHEDGAFFSDDEQASFLSAGLKRAAASIQPPDTVIVNLNAPIEKILAEMKPKWRYNISLAQKKNVIVKSAGTEELEKFYYMLKETALRDGILIHSFIYYKTLFEKCEKYQNLTLRLYTASHEGETIASIIVLFYGKYATYLYGASSDKKRNLMPAYALQWKAIQDAKEAGCLYYDFFGIPPYDNPNHPMAGLYRFKTGFGGQIIHRPGCWDYPYKTFFYTLFNFAENLRKKLRDRKKKR
jgi:lipid II:glycine glycyltransferase (peptidoglycan interpeptide bridge formation enzyme)